MQVSTLLTVTKIASRISNPSSLSNLFRSIQLGPSSLRCCSEYGNMHILMDPTGLDKECLLDTKSLQGLLTTLPQNSEIVLEEKNGRVNYKCGDAKGHLNLVLTDHSIPEIKHDNFPWTPPQSFGNAILLASSACQAAAVSVGLYGVIAEPEGDNLHFMSCNTIALASSMIDKGSYPAGKVTLRPPVPAIIATLISTCPNCMLDVTPEGIFIIGDWLMAHLPLGKDLDRDLKQIANKYTSANETAKINTLAVKKFIARAKSLTDRQVSFTVGLKVESGKLVLVHTGISSSSEEYFLAEGLDPSISYASPVDLPADMLIVPLEFVEMAVFDYLKDQKLVLKGENPQFTYVVSGGN